MNWIESVEIRNVNDVMRELDKKYKVGEDAMKLSLKKYADSNQILTLLKLLEKDLLFFKENAFDGAEELENLIIKAKRYGVSLKFNPFIVRNGLFDTKTYKADFDLADPENTDNVVLAFTAKKKQGVLVATGLYVLDSKIFNHPGVVVGGNEYGLPHRYCVHSPTY